MVGYVRYGLSPIRKTETYPKPKPYARSQSLPMRPEKPKTPKPSKPIRRLLLVRAAAGGRREGV
eukprot:228630-Prorocentrum_minimum.AAC.1